MVPLTEGYEKEIIGVVIFAVVLLLVALLKDARCDSTMSSFNSFINTDNVVVNESQSDVLINE